MAISKIKNSEYYQNGEQYKLGNCYLHGMTNGSGNAFVATVFLPKKIQQGMTVSVSGTWNNIKVEGGASNITGLSLDGASVVSENIVSISGKKSNIGSSKLCNCVPGSDMVLTFTT